MLILSKALKHRTKSSIRYNVFYSKIGIYYGKKSCQRKDESLWQNLLSLSKTHHRSRNNSSAVSTKPIYCTQKWKKKQQKMPLVLLIISGNLLSSKRL
jgi:hypothetical protein